MMKQQFKLLLPLLCLLFTVLPLSAAEIPEERQLPRLVDDAWLLDGFEADQLMDVLDEISTRQGCDIVIVTVSSLGGQSVQSYADDFYDYNGYGQGTGDDGLLLLIDMGERQWHITTHGWAITAFTDYGLAYLEDCFLDDLSSGYYYDAFITFADACDSLLTMAHEGTPYDVAQDNPPSLKVLILPSLGIGFVCALIGTSSMKGKLKTVRTQKNANSYVVSNSLRLIESRDTFLYRSVSRRERPRDTGSGGGSSTHRSSSGRSHGGRGGRF